MAAAPAVRGRRAIVLVVAGAVVAASPFVTRVSGLGGFAGWSLLDWADTGLVLGGAAIGVGGVGPGGPVAAAALIVALVALVAPARRRTL